MGIRENICRKIEEARDLPTLPEIVIKVEKLARSDSASARDLAKIMDHDPSLTARVLKVANSVIYGGRNPITSVTYAVARIGFTEVRNIALSLSVLKLFTSKGFVDYAKFWKHSLAVAFASRALQRHVRAVNDSTDDLFVMGLLHDIGIVLLDQFFPKVYHPVLDIAAKDSTSLSELEKESLGIDHAKVGSLLLERWRLPETVVEAVRCHHFPDMAKQARIGAQVVHLANFMCNNQGIDNGIEAFPSGFSQSSWHDTGLSVDDIPKLIDEVNEEAAKSDVMMALGGT
ncbi:MAG: HDOD domain-containing protein [Pseudomonadota bacterium]